MPEPDEPPREFALRGFVSRPQVQKNNRNSIFIFVNGRLIRDRLLLHALSAAYHNLMPPACFPFALLFLECDCEEVDVNVHPSKTEVRFRHESWVHDFVRDAIREQLMQSRPAPSFQRSPIRSPPRRCRIPISPRRSRTRIAGRSCIPILRCSRRPRPRRASISAMPASVRTSQPEASRQLRIPDTHGGFPLDAIPAGIIRWRASANCARWANSTTASSSRRAWTACGSSISTWRTSAFCSSRC